MFTLCVLLCGCKIEAQDVFQEGFMDVFNSISTFRNEATIGSWMKTIFTRKAYKNYRKKLWVEDIDSLEEKELVDWGNEINTEYCPNTSMTFLLTTEKQTLELPNLEIMPGYSLVLASK
jgi:DNA-directed RNA polymerase specialized sigma24 family protein